MSTYFIGDVHGCLKELQELLNVINFQTGKDTLIFVGDLINRGPDSVGVLRFIRSLESSAQIVLGNHDVSLLAYAAGIYHGKGTDFREIMRANDAYELVEWLRQQPLLIYNEQLSTVVTHAGIPPRWTLGEAIVEARKAEKKLRGSKYEKYLKAAYQGKKEQWSGDFNKYDKFRYRLNGFTRLRYCTVNGEPEYYEKCPVGEQRENLYPWFSLREEINMDDSVRIIFGHWAALGLHESKNAICLDSGCAWGGKMTAMTLVNNKVKYFQNR